MLGGVNNTQGVGGGRGRNHVHILASSIGRVQGNQVIS